MLTDTPLSAEPAPGPPPSDVRESPACPLTGACSKARVRLGSGFARSESSFMGAHLFERLDDPSANVLPADTSKQASHPTEPTPVSHLDVFARRRWAPHRPLDEPSTR